MVRPPPRFIRQQARYRFGPTWRSILHRLPRTCRVTAPSAPIPL